MTPEQLIRDACVKANPEILTRAKWGDSMHEVEDAIRLADVLLAIRLAKKMHTSKQSGHGVQMHASQMLISKEKEVGWNLRADNLSLQSEETKKFLAELLTPDNLSPHIT